MMKNNTEIYYTPEQGKFPVFFSEMLEINDPVLAFDKIMEKIEVRKYIKEPVKTTGRIGYNTVRMLKVIFIATAPREFAFSMRIIQAVFAVAIFFFVGVGDIKHLLSWTQKINILFFQRGQKRGESQRKISEIRPKKSRSSVQIPPGGLF